MTSWTARSGCGRVRATAAWRFNPTLLNPVNQGYGGNQKIGYHYAIEHVPDYVAPLHGDGRHPNVPDPWLLATAQPTPSSVRMFDRTGALRGGMLLYSSSAIASRADPEPDAARARSHPARVILAALQKS